MMSIKNDDLVVECVSVTKSRDAANRPLLNAVFELSGQGVAATATVRLEDSEFENSGTCPSALAKTRLETFLQAAGKALE